MTEQKLLIGDIGGTNARFALAAPDDNGYDDEQVLQCANYESPELAIEDYLTRIGAPAPAAICLAAAGPILDGSVDLTNNNWHIRESNLSVNFGSPHTRLLNDFEAIAYSLPTLDFSMCEIVGLHQLPDLSRPDFSVGVLGPGTGLGAAGLISRNWQTIPLITEAGHVGFAPETALQRAVWEILRHRFGRISDERLISGGGLENILVALSEIHDEPSPALCAADIFQQANHNHLAGEAINLFFEILGQVAGNFALSTGTYDGIYIGGGIVQRYQDLLVESSFRASFENKGRHRHLMERIPTLLIKHEHPGLLGAAQVARQLIASK